MPRPLRLEFPGAYYHVMNRGRRKECIFIKEKEYKIFLSTLKKACEDYQVIVHAYCLMSNHYHLLIQTPLGNLSAFMRQINGVYAQIYNKMNDKEGSLFRGRYRSILIQDGVYLLRVMKYIHLNPVKAKLVADPKDYPWVSHKNYLNRKDEKWLKVKPILALLEGGKEYGLNNYCAYLKADNLEEYDISIRKSNHSVILGNEDFLDAVFKQNYERLNQLRDVSDRRLFLAMGMLKVIKQKIIKEFNIDEKDLVKWGNGMENLPGQMAVYLARENTRLTFREIAAEFCQKSDRTTESCYNRFRAKLRERHHLRRLTERISRGCRYAGT